MSFIDFSCLCMFIVSAHLTESRVLILRDYDDEPLVLGHADRSSAEEVKHKLPAISSNYRPKGTHSKKTVLQYGRHIYHLDSFADLKDLRSKMALFKPVSISYDYVDIDDLFRDSDSTKQIVGDYLKDLFISSNTPLQFCNGDQCDRDLRKFGKHKKMQFGQMKRFQIVDNTHKPKKQHIDSSEEYHEKKKQKTRKRHKQKKKKYSSESAESKSKESGSEEKTRGFKNKKKKKYKLPESSEESKEIKKRPKNKHNDYDSADASVEKWKNYDKDYESEEHFHKKKKKRKKRNYGESDQTKRKALGIDDDFFLQGNKIYHANQSKNKKRHHDLDKRRRLEDFLPKRYHWEPSEIHDLGYYWFNGPKGAYAAPKRLSK